MAKKKVEVKVEEVAEEVLPEVEIFPPVEVHLDRDPNDPRLQETVKELPTYDAE